MAAACVSSDSVLGRRQDLSSGDNSFGDNSRPLVVLVVCPKGLIPSWREHAIEHFPDIFLEGVAEMNTQLIKKMAGESGSDSNDSSGSDDSENDSSGSDSESGSDSDNDDGARNNVDTDFHKIKLMLCPYGTAANNVDSLKKIASMCADSKLKKKCSQV